MKIKVLITVKTYPIPSATYDELVCTAGVTESGEFIRLYPINFRELDFDRQYRKYQWIEIDADKHTGRDARKESYRPKGDTLKVLGEPLGTNEGTWAERAKYVARNVYTSMRALREKQDSDSTSLALFKPKTISKFTAEPDDPEWKEGFKAELLQKRLFETRKQTLQPPRKVPFKFSYHWTCEDEDCNGHKMMIEDWEVGALYWRMRDQGLDEPKAVDAVKSTFYDKICGPKNDTHFYLGTVLSHSTWVIIGMYYPKKKPGGLFFDF